MYAFSSRHKVVTIAQQLVQHSEAEKNLDAHFHLNAATWMTW